MNYKININFAGIFSKYMIGIQNLAELNFEKAYLNIIDKRTSCDAFSYIFKQNYDESYVDIYAQNNYPIFVPIEFSNKLRKYKEVIKKFNFNETFLQKVNFYKKEMCINENTIAVHIRLTDMNIHHKEDYPLVTFDKYLSYFLNNKNYFVASDNKESLIKLKNIYGNNIKYIPNLIRGEKEDENTLNLQINNFKNKDLWEQAFLEMILLSECSTLICRTSSLSNASIIHSNKIQKIIRVDQ